jgi:hypothetical protein
MGADGDVQAGKVVRGRDFESPVQNWRGDAAINYDFDGAVRVLVPGGTDEVLLCLVEAAVEPIPAKVAATVVVGWGAVDVEKEGLSEDVGAQGERLAWVSDYPLPADEGATGEVKSP